MTNFVFNPHPYSLACLQALPPGHQTLLFSATMPKEIEALASQYLNKPIKVSPTQTVTAGWEVGGDQAWWCSLTPTELILLH